MIGFVSLHYKNKVLLEDFILTNKIFDQVISKKDLKTNKVLYPIESSYKGMTYKVDDYKGYLFGNLKYFYLKEESDVLSRQFNYSNLCICIDLLVAKTVKIESTTISKLTLVFDLNIIKSANHFINNNLLMHKLIGYNHDVDSNSKKELKQFERHNYIFGVYSLVKKSSKCKNLLRIELRINKSIEFKKLQIYSILDLKNKTKLRGLFSLFLKRYDELTIIDDIESYDMFLEKDRSKMLLYMNPTYWYNLTVHNKRQAKLNAKKDFERIQTKYNLNHLKSQIRELLIRDFETFIEG